MYGKLFASLYQGTLRGQADAILVFSNMIAFADAHGFIDKHPSAIADETGLTVERVRAAIDLLTAPDPESRSPDENGKRLVLMDEHRNWGWKIVNHGKYRMIKTEEDRREANRLAQERWRNKSKQGVSNSKHPVSASKQDKPKQKQEAEAYTEAKNTLFVASDEKEFLTAFGKLARIKPIRKLTDSRREKLLTRLSEPGWDWREAFKKLPIPGDGWQPDFDWIVANESNLFKIIEGKYEWRAKNDRNQRPITAGVKHDPAAKFGEGF